MHSPCDAELAARARAGDPSGLGALVERHRPGMLAVAFSLLGHCPEADDAVQEAIVVALSRVGELRDGNAAGAWLRAIVRNHCRMARRRQRAELGLEALASAAASPEQLLEGHQLRASIFQVLDGLSESVQLSLLLRYFTDLTSYQEIAAFSGVPIGTVRSRLAEGRRKLAEWLLEAGRGADDEVCERQLRRSQQAQQVLAEAEQGRFSRAAPELFDPRLTIVGPNAAWGTDLPFLAHVFERDCSDGVRHVLRNVVASSRVTLWEMDLVSPASDPTHCPPSIVWAHFQKGGRTRRLRLYHSAR